MGGGGPRWWGGHLDGGVVFDLQGGGQLPVVLVHRDVAMEEKVAGVALPQPVEALLGAGGAADPQDSHLAIRRLCLWERRYINHVKVVGVGEVYQGAGMLFQNIHTSALQEEFC